MQTLHNASSVARAICGSSETMPSTPAAASRRTVIGSFAVQASTGAPKRCAAATAAREQSAWWSESASRASRRRSSGIAQGHRLAQRGRPGTRQRARASGSSRRRSGHAGSRSQRGCPVRAGRGGATRRRRSWRRARDPRARASERPSITSASYPGSFTSRWTPMPCAGEERERVVERQLLPRQLVQRVPEAKPRCDVELDDVRAGGDRRFERREGVLRRDRGRAAVADHERPAAPCGAGSRDADHDDGAVVRQIAAGEAAARDEHGVGELLRRGSARARRARRRGARCRRARRRHATRSRRRCRARPSRRAAASRGPARTSARDRCRARGRRNRAIRRSRPGTRAAAPDARHRRRRPAVRAHGDVDHRDELARPRSRRRRRRSRRRGTPTAPSARVRASGRRTSPSPCRRSRRSRGR